MMASRPAIRHSLRWLCGLLALAASAAMASSTAYVTHHPVDMAFDLPSDFLHYESQSRCDADTCEWIWSNEDRTARLHRESEAPADAANPSYLVTNPFGIAFEIDSRLDIPPKESAQAVCEVGGWTYRFKVDLGDPASSDAAARQFVSTFRTVSQLQGLELVHVATDRLSVTLRNSSGFEFPARPGDWLGTGLLVRTGEDHIVIQPERGSTPHAETRILRAMPSPSNAFRLHHVIGYQFELPTRFPLRPRQWGRSIDSRDQSWDWRDQTINMSVATHIGGAEGPEVVNADGARFRVESQGTGVHAQLVDELLHLFVSVGDSDESMDVARHLIDSLRRVDRIPGLELASIAPDLETVVLRNEVGIEWPARVGDQVAGNYGELSEIHPDHVVVVQLFPNGRGGWEERYHELHPSPAMH